MNDKQTKKDGFKFEEAEPQKKGKFSKGYKGKKFNPNRRGSLNYNSGKKFNDVSWYKKNEGITSAFVKLPFNYIIGNPVYNSNVNGYRVPILLSYIVDWCANNGCTFDSKDFNNKSILDLVATIIYTTMRRNNSGATNGIEYVDPIISNLLASIDILANAVSMRRVFKIANTFSWKNRLLPKIIFRHLGIDYDDFISNQANYRGKYNTLVAKARTIKTLANFDFVNSICAQFENLFKDEDTDTGREQLYLPMKGFHHIYDPVGTTGYPGGMVRLMIGSDIGISSGASGEATILTANTNTDVATEPATSLPLHRKFEVDLMILEKQIDALINDSDFNLIQADIEKAFGEQSGYMVIDGVPDNIEPLTPIYSGENALMVKHGVFNDLNGTVSSVVSIPTFNNSNVRTIRKNQVVNTIYQRHNNQNGESGLGFWHHYMCATGDADVVPSTSTIPRIAELLVHPYLNLEENDPHEDSIIIGTRYQNIYKYDPEGALDMIPEDFRPASEGGKKVMLGQVLSNFILYGGIITMLLNENSGNVKVEHYRWSTAILGKNTVANAALIVRLAITNFKYHPGVYNNLALIPGELNNIRFLTKDELDNIHKSCFLSLWDLPSKTNI